ncbi:hypothetical protein BCR39DRAFT_505706 [Naematelia encephala]|uniref:Uncharacterized protein n=1 Tax=Naematelia encephala TaxID=71784 RepID=A0A1Y2B2P4_9TREE|nr:hypothetical protein BCR39DRAFT_505706 [Naematelia encephala]
MSTMTPPIFPRRTASSTSPSISRRHSSSLSPMRPRRASTAATARPRRRDSTSTIPDREESEWDDGTADLGDIDEEGEDGDAEEEWERGTRSEGRRKKAKDEPMSPVAVVFYVTALYLIFQILTRSDEHEILSHLNISPSSLASTFRSDMSSSQLQSPYHLPYHLPQIPSPIPSAQQAGSTSTWRVVLAVAVYPVYLLITLLAIPLPLLMNVVHLVLTIVQTVLYPFTSTARLLTRTLLVAPLGVAATVTRALYPVWVFIGGTISVGCVLGVSAGWAGRALLDWALGRPRKGRSRRVKRTRSSKSKSILTASTSAEKSSDKVKEREREPKREISPSSGDDPILHTPVAAVHPGVFQPNSARKKFDHSQEIRAMGTGREAIAMGTRRRGHVLEG